MQLERRGRKGYQDRLVLPEQPEQPDPKDFLVRLELLVLPGQLVSLALPA